MNYKTPGVYIEEIPKLPPSIAQVETAIPAFIGYTDIAVDDKGDSLIMEPKRIKSLLEYERFFGFPDEETGLKVTINGDAANPKSVLASIEGRSKYLMHYGLQIFFANGGGPCYIVSVGDYTTGQINSDTLIEGLNATEKVDEVTLYVYPDAQGIENEDNFYSVFKASLDMCEELKDRFTVMDIWQAPNEPDYLANIATMRL